MAKISELPDDLLVKILTFLPTKAAVSTSVLSKQWEFLWMWLPELEFNFPTSRSKYACLRDFIAKNLPLHKAPVIESLRIIDYHSDYRLLLLRPEDLNSWVGTAVSRGLRELSIHLSYGDDNLLLPRFLYSCNSLVTLKLCEECILVDVPPTVCLPSLKTLELGSVTYSNEDSLRLLLSCCPALEDLSIDREDYDNLRKFVIIVPSLQRLTLCINEDCSSDGYVVVTPSLKYFNVVDERSPSPYFIEHMPELEKADITLMRDTENDTERLLWSGYVI
ncbi:PREDICTED: putative FBD-associated F-box protein At5g56700 [Camelina sativa]|uniref:FBD-associated F-box protein At5g56700 n=1 Tax=Camelina sativa TaxID=90675 RepID=A0ABM1QLL8_CAMSA|nr:PREDICTED: putative FBD-associated F-box protein At5g56700 [Camelina sativa]